MPHTQQQLSDDDSDTHSESGPTTLVTRGATVSPHQVTQAWQWWNKEIAPWRGIILGRWEAARFDSMPTLQQWYTAKYRYDHHYHYQTQAPPPQEMWETGILEFCSPEARAWMAQRDMEQAYTSSSDDMM